MLKLENIFVSFGHLEVLKNLSCEVEAGDFIIIVGTNGAGKSTLFDVIAGKTKPNAGSIILENVDITKNSELEKATLITRLFQNTHLNSVGSMTVAQNLAMALYSRRPATLANGMSCMSREQAKKLLSPLEIDVDAFL